MSVAKDALDVAHLVVDRLVLDLEIQLGAVFVADLGLVGHLLAGQGPAQVGLMAGEFLGTKHVLDLHAEQLSGGLTEGFCELVVDELDPEIGIQIEAWIRDALRQNLEAVVHGGEVRAHDSGGFGHAILLNWYPLRLARLRPTGRRHRTAQLRSRQQSGR